jgi:sigma-B regulation protein RsbU (phosphoserine phosphatase)
MALVIGDVSGKGLPAAIFMAQSHALLRASAESDASVLKVLEKVNNFLQEMNAQSLFVTVVYGVLHKSSGEFHYARAGHELPLILDVEGTISVPAMRPGMPVGLLQNPPLDEQSVIIPPGGCMILYSDGPADTRNAEGVRFGENGFKNAIRQYGIHYPAQQICQTVYDCLLEYQNGAPQFDDVTLLAVRRTG